MKMDGDYQRCNSPNKDHIYEEPCKNLLGTGVRATVAGGYGKLFDHFIEFVLTKTRQQKSKL